MSEWFVHVLNPLRPLCDEWCLHLWETAGTWFAGVATFAAVVVSLVLAKRDQIRLRVSAGHRIVMGPGAVAPYRELVIISVRNIGSRPAIVEGIGWRRRFYWRWPHAYQTFDPMGGFPGPPATIAPGDAHHFKLPLSHTEMQWGEWFVKDFVGRWPRFGVHFIRVQAWTPAGDSFTAPLEPSLREWLVKKAATMRAA